MDDLFFFFSKLIWTFARPDHLLLLLLTLAMLLLGWRSPRRKSRLAALLLLGYAVGMAVNLGRGRTSIDCGCHGFSGRQQIAGWMVVRNLGLATLAVVLARLGQGSEPLPLPAAADWVTVVGATAMGCLLYALLHYLMANASKLAR